tara:strand:- start:1207 stop:5010 length:3804 start_codon:yes stop_codon:yes gene_type:complete
MADTVTMRKGGQFYQIDITDNPSDEEILLRRDKQHEDYLSQVPETPKATPEILEKADEVEQEKKGVGANVAEVPFGIASGVTKGLSAIDRFADRITGGGVDKVDNWFNQTFLNLGYVTLTEDGRVGWNKAPATKDDQSLDFTIFDMQTPTGKITDGLSKFLTGMVFSNKLRTGVFGKDKTKVGKVTGAMTDAVIGEQFVFDPFEDRLSNLVEDLAPEYSNLVTDALMAKEGDTEMEARVKMAGEALIIEGVFFPLAATIRGLRALRSGKKVNVDDEKELTAYIDSLSETPEVSIKELEDKLKFAQANDAFNKRMDDIKAVKGDSTISPAEIKKAKLEANKKQLEDTPDSITDVWKEEFGVGTGTTNRGMIQRADNIIKKAFVDSPNIRIGIKNIQETILKHPKNFDLQVAAIGRLTQLTTKNYLKSKSNYDKIITDIKNQKYALDNKPRTPRSKTNNLEQNIKIMNEIAERDEAQKQLLKLGAEAKTEFNKARNELIWSIGAFKGNRRASGNALQIQKLFQGFGVADKEVEKHFDKLLANAPTSQVRNAFISRALDMLSAKTVKNVLRGLDEIFIANILTGIKTHVVNTTTNTAWMLYKPLEIMGASGIRALSDKTGAGIQFREGMAQYKGLLRNFNESRKMGMDAYFKARSFLDNNTTYEMQQKSVFGDELVWGKTFKSKTLRELSNEIEINPNKATLSSLFNTGIKAFSTRGLVMEDEFFKNMAYRSRVYGKAYVKNYDLLKAQGLKGKELTKAAVQKADEQVRLSVDEQMNMNRFNAYETTDVYQADALQYSRESTFTQDLGKRSAQFQKAVGAIPLARQIFPFIRTPLNLISESIKRSPLARLSPRWNKARREGTPEEKALAWFQLAEGMSIYTGASLAWGITMEDAPISGTGQGTWTQMQNAREVGGQLTTAFTLGDTQYQFNRFDPFSTIFESFGVMAELARSGQYEGFQDVSTSMSIGLMKMLANDTYATSVRQLMRAIEDESGQGMRKFMMSRVQQLVPLSGMNKTIGTHDDPIAREMRTYLDAVKAGLGLNKSLAPNYDLLGREVMRPRASSSADWTGYFGEAGQRFVNLTMPLATRQVDTDPVAVEIVNQDVATPEISPFPVRYAGTIDLNNKEFSVGEDGSPLYGEGKTAYDRLNEILRSDTLMGDMSLYEHLTNIITSPEYGYEDFSTDKMFVDTPFGRRNLKRVYGSRREQLTAAISKAHQLAINQLEQENPNLAKQAQKWIYIKGLVKSKEGQALIEASNEGVDLNEVLEGAN